MIGINFLKFFAGKFFVRNFSEITALVTASVWAVYPESLYRGGTHGLFSTILTP